MLGDGKHDVPTGKIATVVTYLEMTAPRLRGVPLPDGLEFVRFAPDVATYRALFHRVGADWLWFGRAVMSDADLAQVLSDPDFEFYTLMKDGQPEALLELGFWEKDACELAYFGVAPALIGAGAGAYLMDRAIEAAFARPITRFHLHTCTLDSPQAMGFYRRSGFAVTHQKVEIADDPRIAHDYDPALAPHVPLIRP